MPMCRRSVSRIVVVLLALPAAFAAPATALAHGRAHHAESAAHASTAAAVAPDEPASGSEAGGGVVEPGVANLSHAELHSPNVAPRLGDIGVPRPAIRGDELAAHFSTSASTVDPTTLVRYISPHRGKSSQPRAPPLG